MFGHENALYDEAFEDILRARRADPDARLPRDLSRRRAAPPGPPARWAMGYDLNFNLIWRHFDKLWNGLILSLELAVLSIAIGIVIGLVLAVAYVSAGRWGRAAIAAYVEFIRNVPLILLVYLVFYGLPQVVDLATARRPRSS